MKPFLFWLLTCTALMLMGLTLAMLPNHWKGAAITLCLVAVNLTIFVRILRGT